MRAIASSSSLDPIIILLTLEWLPESRGYDKLQMSGRYRLWGELRRVLWTDNFFCSALEQLGSPWFAVGQNCHEREVLASVFNLAAPSSVRLSRTVPRGYSYGWIKYSVLLWVVFCACSRKCSLESRDKVELFPIDISVNCSWKANRTPSVQMLSLVTVCINYVLR